jgi:hypothetical protein
MKNANAGDLFITGILFNANLCHVFSVEEDVDCFVGKKKSENKCLSSETTAHLDTVGGFATTSRHFIRTRRLLSKIFTTARFSDIYAQ